MVGPGGSFVMPDAEPKAPSSVADVDQVEVTEKILKRLIASAKENQKQFFEIGDTINRFAYRRGASDKQSEVDLQLPFTAVLSKGSQFVSVIGGTLFQKNPDIRANPRPWADPAAIQRAQLMQDFLTYAASQDGEETEHRKAGIDAIIYGMGVVRQGWNEEKKIPQDVHVPIKDYLWDPDASSKPEGHWRAQRRRKPRWWLYKNIPGCDQILEGVSADGKKPSENVALPTDYTTETITIWEMWFDHGLSNYQSGAALLKPEGDDETLVADDDPVYYIITDSGKLLKKSSWQVPLWRRQMWPLQELDLIEVPNEYAGRSPIEPGLSQLETMDYLYRTMIARMRMAAHAALIEMVANGQKVGAENMDRIMNATTEDGIFSVLQVVWDGMGEAPDIHKMLQEFHINSMLEEFTKAIDYTSQEWEKATGLYGILYMGQTETQARSAEEVAFKEKTSRGRIDNMISQVEHHATRCATVRAAIARYLAKEQDLVPIFGPQRAQVWGFICPPVADEAAQLSQEMQAQGAPPDIADNMGMLQATMNSAQRQAQGGIELDQWFNEADYTIAAGTCQTLDTDELKALYDKANVQVVPELLGNPNPQMQAVGLAVQLEMFKVYGAPQRLQDLIVQAISIVIAPPPPPPGMGPPGPGGAPVPQGPHGPPAPNRPASQPGSGGP